MHRFFSSDTHEISSKKLQNCKSYTELYEILKKENLSINKTISICLKQIEINVQLGELELKNNNLSTAYSYYKSAIAICDLAKEAIEADNPNFDNDNKQIELATLSESIEARLGKPLDKAASKSDMPHFLI